MGQTSCAEADCCPECDGEQDGGRQVGEDRVREGDGGDVRRHFGGGLLTLRELGDDFVFWIPKELYSTRKRGSVGVESHKMHRRHETQTEL